jgi:hypothetical protein
MYPFPFVVVVVIVIVAVVVGVVVVVVASMIALHDSHRTILCPAPNFGTALVFTVARICGQH